MNQPSQHVLSHLRGRLFGFLSLRAALAVAAAIGLGAMAAIAADAIFVLPESARIAAPYVLAAVAGLVAIAALWSLRRLSQRAVARRFETRYSELGTTMTNAVQFAGETSSANQPVRELLRQQAVAVGRDKARRIATWPVAKRGVVAALIATAAALCIWAAGPVLFPDVFAAVLPRFTDPTGDHPPYSRVKIEAKAATASVLYGGECEIHATASGAPVEKLFLIAQPKDGPPIQTVMFRRPDNSYFQTLTNLREPTRFWVTDGRARSRYQAIDVKLTPRITLVQLTTDYPAYTGIASREAELKETALEVPQFSSLAFRVASNRPLRHGSITITPLLGGEPQTIELAAVPDHAHIVAGGFEVTEAAAYEITVRDVDGLVSAQSIKGRITLLPDQRPRIAVVEPDRHAVATPSATIPVKVQAEDDYGVQEMIWFRGFNQSIERAREMELAFSTPKRVNSDGSFSLAELGVRPGDKIEYFFEAVDNYPQGPNVATSRIYTLEIISEEQFMEIMRTAAAQQDLFEQYQNLDDMLARLLEAAEELERMSKQGATPEELKEQLNRTRQSAAEYNHALELVSQMPELFDIEDLFKAHLAEQKKQLADARKMMKEMAEASNSLSSGALDPELVADLTNALRRMRKESRENVGEPVEHLLQVVKLVARAEEFAQLTLEQREIARLLERFRDHTGELSRVQQMELQELAAREQAVRDNLRRLLEELPDLVAQVPEEPQYEKLILTTNRFLEAVEEAQIQDDLNSASDYLVGLEGALGQPVAQRAYEKMDALVGKCRNIGGEAGECPLAFAPKMCAAMPGAMQQVLAALQGRGQGSGGAGYGLYGQDVGLYGPNMQATRRANRRGTGRNRDNPGHAPTHDETAGNPQDDPDLPVIHDETRVQLQHNANFPLRYRDLVGEYFRAIAEAEEE